MSNRPITRSKNNKNKKQRIDDNAEATSQILRKINSTGQVTEDDVNQLNMTWKPVCQGCRQNTKDNPNCFCGLIPPATGSRKSGLWQKMSEIVHSLGPDPSKDLRSCPDSPAGLTNLGATCYANSILQCLYMNKSFREGVFSVEPEVLEEQPVLNKLARLFAQLHASKMAFVDSAPFIETLELDNGIQQDSHEFLTLLFSLLERCLSCSKVFKARTVVQDLFRGGVSHVTRCSKCGNNSEASSKIEDFYGLELNVKGLKSLDESLDDCFSIEELQGDNQYYCESCATRVNATRSIKLRSLPPVLNFQLRRCIFLPNTTTKKKITSAFCFPGELNMSHRLSENRQSDLIYDLSAVLIHKGSAVNSGHYVAHIKDENTQQWWEFDDEHVSNLGQNPFGESSSDAAAKPVQTEAIVHSPCPEALDVAVNGNVEVGRSQCPDSCVSNGFFHVQTFSSSDAYLLMYVLRHPKNGSAEAPRDFLENKKMGNGDMISSLCEASLPSHLCEEVKKLNQSYLESCENYRSKKELAVNQIVEQRQEIRSILNEAPVQSIEEPYYWISTDWLRHWADNVSPSAINNAPILCIHGKVPITAVGRIKRLSAKAWTMLFSKYGGGPIVGKVDYCVHCLVEKACTMVRADSYRDKRTAMKELAEAALAGNFPDDALYYISRSWLQQWLRRKNTDSPCEADAGPTVSIRCPHGELMPEQAAGARRLLVPEKLWNFLYETANSVKPDDPLGCSVFLLGSEPCAQCSVELTEVASLEDNLREFKLKQRQSHERLASGKNLVLDSHSRYYLMPSTWLSTWKNYISASGKSAAASAQPETLNSVIDFLKCEQHSKLLERPPHILSKRGVIQQKGPTMDGLTIVTESDWKLFCEDWGGTEMEGISAEIELADNLTGSCEQMPICEENVDRHGELNGEGEMKRLVIRTSPEVCEHCIGERESCELMRKLNYQNEEICVCFIRGKEPPKSILEASACTLESNRRISKRSRKAAFGNSINLNVSGSTSIYQLKMMIWESFGVVKENQVLHKGSKVIDRESATLADLNIFPGDVLWVKDSEIHENRDIADEISDQKLEIQRVEEGFRGTLLTSNVSSQIVSEACFN